MPTLNKTKFCELHIRFSDFVLKSGAPFVAPYAKLRGVYVDGLRSGCFVSVKSQLSRFLFHPRPVEVNVPFYISFLLSQPFFGILQHPLCGSNRGENGNWRYRSPIPNVIILAFFCVMVVRDLNGVFLFRLSSSSKKNKTCTSCRDNEVLLSLTGKCQELFAADSLFISRLTYVFHRCELQAQYYDHY